MADGDGAATTTSNTFVNCGSERRSQSPALASLKLITIMALPRDGHKKDRNFHDRQWREVSKPPRNSLPDTTGSWSRHRWPSLTMRSRPNASGRRTGTQTQVNQSTWRLNLIKIAGGTRCGDRPKPHQPTRTVTKSGWANRARATSVEAETPEHFTALSMCHDSAYDFCPKNRGATSSSVGSPPRHPATAARTTTRHPRFRGAIRRGPDAA